MPKIYETINRVRIHTGPYWRKYKQIPELFEDWRVHDVGRKGKSQRLAVKVRGKWVNYGWSFDKSQVKFNPRTKTLTVYDRKAYEILMSLKAKGELKGYKIIKRFKRR
jgi:hypothetical protein